MWCGHTAAVTVSSSRTVTSNVGTVPVTGLFFFFNDTAPTEIYTLSLHDALPICRQREHHVQDPQVQRRQRRQRCRRCTQRRDRKSTRLNSSHGRISDAVFRL